jgi:hypothetical protein
MPDSDPDGPRERLELSAAQVAASSLAAVSAAVLCSYFGVAGTIVGTAAASIVATVGSALYSFSLRRTRSRLRRMHLAAPGTAPVAAGVEAARQQGRRLARRLPWRIIALGTANVFVFSIGVVTGIEGLIGEPLSAAYGGGHSQQTCSLCRHDRHTTATPTTPATPGPTQRVSPSSVPSSSVTPSSPASQSPSTGPSPSSSPSPSSTEGSSPPDDQ